MNWFLFLWYYLCDGVLLQSLFWWYFLFWCCSSNQSVSLTAEGDHLDYSHPPTYLIKNTPASEGTSITVTDPKIDQPKQEVLLAPEGHPNLTVQSAQNYGLNFMSTMLGTQQVQFEGSESQAQETSRFPNFVVSSSIFYFLRSLST